MNEVSKLLTPSAVRADRSLILDIQTLSRGIDNYQFDVKLSRKFSASVRKIGDLLLAQTSVPVPKYWDNSKQFEELRDVYIDMMTVLIHRLKTNLKPNEICFLQMAAVKYIIRYLRTRFEEDIAKVATRTSELRNKGSSEALTSDQRLFWLRKNYDTVLYQIFKQIFNQLQRAEHKALAAIRAQYMPSEYQEFTELLFNPLLFTSDLNASQLLISEYCLWDNNGNPAGFVQLNDQLEKLLNTELDEIPSSHLRAKSQEQSGYMEVHDEFGGFIASQAFLGQAKDNRDSLEEALGWLDDPATVQSLFNIDKHNEDLQEIRKQLGFVAWWQRRAEVKKIKRILTKLIRMLKTQNLFNQLIASYQLKEIWTLQLAEKADLKTVTLYVSGQSAIRKTQDAGGLASSTKLSAEQIRYLDEIKLKVQQLADTQPLEFVARILIDLSRYRLHLKYYRMAHRILNRINILNKQSDIKLSFEAGTLYSLATNSEIEEDEERICHHAILKADVRGSTTVTDELQNKGLNPASYFSLRFFDPINTFIEAFAARKVFIEGDAIILSFLEYEHTPQQWFSVARACGMAREMLGVVAQNNRHSNQMELPVLELGIGICFANTAPRFLYDDDKPIMISGAIGLADRLSSCSWNLREKMQPGLFNIDVFKYPESEKSKDEKGQLYVRYNVNGILIDDLAFAKLQEEMTMRRIKLKLNGKDYIFYVGQYPDVNGNKRELVVREGSVGIWRDGVAEEVTDGTEKYYEVVVNKKVITLIMEYKNREQASG